MLLLWPAVYVVILLNDIIRTTSLSIKIFNKFTQTSYGKKVIKVNIKFPFNKYLQMFTNILKNIDIYLKYYSKYEI